jgi:hypothetical protein
MRLGPQDVNVGKLLDCEVKTPSRWTNQWKRVDEKRVSKFARESALDRVGANKVHDDKLMNREVAGHPSSKSRTDFLPEPFPTRGCLNEFYELINAWAMQK